MDYEGIICINSHTNRHMNKQLIENLKRFSLSILLTFCFLSPLLSNNYEAGNVRYFEEFDLPVEAAVIAEQFDMQEPTNTVEAEHEYDLILDKVVSEGRITNKLNKSVLY